MRGLFLFKSTHFAKTIRIKRKGKIIKRQIDGLRVLAVNIVSYY